MIDRSMHVETSSELSSIQANADRVLKSSGKTIGSGGRIVRNWTVKGKQYKQYEYRLVWIKHFGDIPQRYVVHHIDGDKNNNNIDNLRCMTQSDHIKMHLTIVATVCSNCGVTAKISKMGLCHSCKRYYRKYNKNKPKYPEPKPISYCPKHPDRRAEKLGLCRSCYQVQLNRKNRALLKAKQSEAK
jgi:hypothetical protein